MFVFTEKSRSVDFYAYMRPLAVSFLLIFLFTYFFVWYEIYFKQIIVFVSHRYFPRSKQGTHNERAVHFLATG